MARTDYSGKRGSNAGDDYHELWAARRALELITPATQLVELTVEGVRADDAHGVDDALWDGVDAAFYYGPDVDTIEGVDLVQFKYSGSDPYSAWTVARLAYATNNKKTNALINRLATAWKGMRAQRPDLDAADNIAVKLASNQPIAQEVHDALVAAPGDSLRKKLHVASGLSASEFNAFVLVLDFSGCGDQSRFVLEDRVIRALSDLKDGDVRAEFAVLREFIRKRMRPEGKAEKITAESVYGLFGHADKRAFYPCPTKISKVEHLIPRSAAETIRALFAQGIQKICLAGGGGEGKTTILQDLADRLPAGSELIVYDCYGEGTYLNSNGYRHRAEDAFLQLANEAAARLLLPPLFSEQGVDHPRRFANKLAAAAGALASRNPNALLVIAVDATDNAVTAAAQCVPPERAFVHDLAKLGSLPANVRLMFSARTGRLSELQLPDDVKQVELGPFSQLESRAFAEGRLGPQSDDWHAEFHAFSGGNPRVQRYAIEFADEAAEGALDYLKPNGKNLALIFNARLEEARFKVGSITEIARLCAALILLPRPVPLDQLAAVIEVETAHARDLILDLAPGLVLAEGLVGFADEDFEHFVRETGQSEMGSVLAIATDRLMAQRAVDSYAARHVANLALLAQRREDVIALVREPVSDYPIDDPAARGVVHRSRLRAAMHVCRDTKNVVDAAALLLEGAQAIKTDDAVHRTLLAHVELGANFSRDAIFGLLLRDRDRRPAHGALLLHLSGIDGISGDRIGMKAHFRSFLAWQENREEARRDAQDDSDEQDPINSAPEPSAERRRHRISSEQFAQEWPLEADDVAAMLVGRLHAENASDALGMVRRPRPARFRLAVLRCLVLRLARLGNIALLSQILDSLPRRHPGHPMVALAVGLAGGSFDAAAMLSRLEAVAAQGNLDIRDVDSDYMPDNSASEALRFTLDACDLTTSHGADRARLAAILARAMPDRERSPAAMSSYSPRGSDLAARAFALASVLNREPVTFERFIVDSSPPPTNPAARKRRGKAAAQSRGGRDHDADRRKAKELYEPILNLHAVRSAVLVGDIAPSEASAALTEALKKLGASRRYQGRQDDWRTRDDAAIRALFSLGAIPGLDAAALFNAIRDALGDSSSLMRFGILTLLERASIVPGFRPGIVDMAITTCDHVRGFKISAEEKIDYLVGLAKLLLPLDASASRYCFDAAMGVAGDVDYDTLHGISITAVLAKRARSAVNESDAVRLALLLAAVHQDAAIRLGSADQFPWEDVAVSLAALAPNVALATDARFSELDLIRGQSLLAKMLSQCAADRTLDDAVLAAFLPILGDNGGELATMLAERAGNNNEISLADEVARHQLLEPCGSHVEQAAALARLAAPGPATRDFLAVAAFEAALPEQEAEREAYRSEWSGTAAERKLIDPAMYSPVGIDGVASFQARIDAIIHAQDSPYTSRRQVAVSLLAKVPDYRVGEFLEILVSIPEGDDAIYDLAHLLVGQLDRWHGKSAAVQWANTKLLRAIEARLPEFVWNIGYRAPDLAQLLERTGADHTEVVDRLLSAIERHIGSLTSFNIFYLVGLLSDYFTPDQAYGILDQHAGSLHRRLEPADRNIPGFDTITDSSTSVARHLYAQLAHIAHARRWRAAYGLRVLARLGRGDMLDRVRELYQHRYEPAFSHPEAPFYFWAARLWLMLALARIAWETPEIVSPYRDWLFEQAERIDFPHLLVRAAAKQGLEGLVRANPDEFDREAQARIAAINVSPLPRQTSTQESWNKGFDRHHPLSDEGRRFRFDSLDTLPYWYSPLMRCFADPDPEQFLVRAERWIVDELGVIGDIWGYDKLRGNSRFNGRGNESSHSHGSLPAIERYRTHLEWHALYLAGGEILSEWPLSDRADEDAWDSFEGWLARQGPTLAPIWLGDLRGTKPLEQIVWQSPSKQIWLKIPDSEAFRYALGLDRPEWLIVSSHRSLHYRDMVGSTRIESALVSRDTATSLRLALEASENSYQYRLAVNDDDSHEIDTGRFVLRSMLVDRNGDTELDIHDPLRGEVSAPSQLPHSRIIEMLGLSRDLSGMPVWRDRSGTIIIQWHAWSDPKQSEYASPQKFVQGDELLFRRSAIVKILETHGLDLITELTFNRRIGEVDYGLKKDRKREREIDRIIIFRQDGTIEASTRGLGHWA